MCETIHMTQPRMIKFISKFFGSVVIPMFILSRTVSESLEQEAFNIDPGLRSHGQTASQELCSVLI